MYKELLLSQYFYPLLDLDNQIELAIKLVHLIRAVVYLAYLLCRTARELINKTKPVVITPPTERASEEEQPEEDSQPMWSDAETVAKWKEEQDDGVPDANSSGEDEVEYLASDSLELCDLYYTDLEDYGAEPYVEDDGRFEDYTCDEEDYSDEYDYSDESDYYEEGSPEYYKHEALEEEEVEEPYTYASYKPIQNALLHGNIMELWPDLSSDHIWRTLFTEGKYEDEPVLSEDLYVMVKEIKKAIYEGATLACKAYYAEGGWTRDLKEKFYLELMAAIDEFGITKEEKWKDDYLNNLSPGGNPFATFFKRDLFYLHPVLELALPFKLNKSAESFFTYDELKSEYRRLSKLYHPDCSGSEEAFNKFNPLFEYLLAASRYHTAEYPVVPYLACPLP